MLKIQEFSKKTGISKRMLRYLEDQGLLIPERKENDYRVYHTRHLEDIRWIQFWQKLGFSLKQIQKIKSLDVSKIEIQLQNLLSQKKQELAAHANQLSSLREVARALRQQEFATQPAAFNKIFKSLQTMEFSAREDFVCQFDETERTVYGKFPEVDDVLEALTLKMSSTEVKVTTQAIDIIKAGQSLVDLPEIESFLGWERKNNYAYFFAAFPHSIRFESRLKELEKNLGPQLESSLNQFFLLSPLEQVGRLFEARDLFKFYGPQEIVFRATIQVEIGKKVSSFYLLIPFLFIHSSRGEIKNQGSTTT